MLQSIRPKLQSTQPMERNALIRLTGSAHKDTHALISSKPSLIAVVSAKSISSGTAVTPVPTSQIQRLKPLKKKKPLKPQWNPVRFLNPRKGQDPAEAAVVVIR